MIWFIKSLNHELHIIKDGAYVPSKIVDRVIIKKNKNKKMCDDLNKKKMQLNAETVNVLFYTK